jgi:hypothetical protein
LILSNPLSLLKAGVNFLFKIPFHRPHGRSIFHMIHFSFSEKRVKT